MSLPLFFALEEPLKFPESGTIVTLVLLAMVLLWLTGLSLTNRVSRLHPRRKTMVNLLSLFTGPIGWSIHMASRRQFEQETAGESDEEPAVRANGLASGVRKEKHLSGTLPPAASTPKHSKWTAWLHPEERTNATDSKVFEKMMLDAVEAQATDIHLEPRENGYQVRIRVNGILRDQHSFPRDTGEHVIAIIKVMANMDVADRLRAQDGRFAWSSPQSSVNLDVRVSVSPSLRGEKAALRFLNRPTGALELEQLGMNTDLQKAVRRVARHPEGFILVAGPTGSGKTSTAYGILQTVAGPSVNTMTIEDPVEYTLPHATQIAVSPKMGITFESGLTTLLRQDPDVIFVGEMREPESFRIGIRASLSGHLVISTMHARDSVQVFATLRNLGIDPSHLAAGVKMVISQRLVRILCDACKQPEESTDEDIRAFLGESGDSSGCFQPGPGCPECHYSAFTGRTGVFEFLTMDGHVREWIEKNRPESELRRIQLSQGHGTMRDDVRQKVMAGWVWAEDGLRAVGLEERS